LTDEYTDRQTDRQTDEINLWGERVRCYKSLETIYWGSYINPKYAHCSTTRKKCNSAFTGIDQPPLSIIVNALSMPNLW
jgi:hypothetical protein